MTPKLVAEIQALLKNGYADWFVDVRLIVDGVPPDGIVIWAEKVEEEWNRSRLKKRLGDRLKV